MGEHDVPYFRGILVDHTARLKELCKEWQDISSLKDVPEDVCGEIRTTIGLTELLMDQRFKQFSGLVDNCEYKRGEKITTCEDLQGFWDMVYQEVEKVNKKFNDLVVLKANDWETKQDSKPVPVLKKKSVQGKNLKQGVLQSKASSKASSNARAYIMAARQKLAEAKAQQKTALKNASTDSEEAKENVSANVKSKILEQKKAKGTPGGVSKGSPEDVSKGISSVSRGRRAKDKVPKDFIPLACVTRAAARALMAKNQSTQ